MEKIGAACEHGISSQPFGNEVRNIHSPRYLSDLLFADNAGISRSSAWNEKNLRPFDQAVPLSFMLKVLVPSRRHSTLV